MRDSDRPSALGVASILCALAAPAVVFVAATSDSQALFVSQPLAPLAGLVLGRVAARRGDNFYGGAGLLFCAIEFVFLSLSVGCVVLIGVLTGPYD